MSGKDSQEYRFLFHQPELSYPHHGVSVDFDHLPPPTVNKAVLSLPLTEYNLRKPAKTKGLNQIKNFIRKYENFQVSIKKSLTHVKN
jgi:hypothetical protein